MGLFSKSSSTQNQYTTNNSLTQGFNDDVTDSQVINGDNNSVIVSDHESVKSAFSFAENASENALSFVSDSQDNLISFVSDAHDDLLDVIDSTQRSALASNERATNAILDVASGVVNAADPDGQAMKYMTAVLIASAVAFAYAMKK